MADSSISRVVRTLLKETGESSHHTRFGGPAGDRAGAADEVAALPPTDSLLVGMRIGTFVRMSCRSSGPDGVPSNDLFRIEYAVKRDEITHVVLRWFAEPVDVVGIGPHQLARTTLFFMVRLRRLLHLQYTEVVATTAEAGRLQPVDYLIDLLATRDEFQDAGVSVDDEFWKHEPFVRLWLANPVAYDHYMATPCKIDAFMERLRCLLDPIRRPLIARPQPRTTDSEQSAPAAMRG
eukprot:m51a1_g13335 hypothetical protein (236) ;mRNA; f:1256-2318